MNTPQRIQRKRTKGFRLPPNTVSVTRPGKWGNTYLVGRDGTAEECVEKYRKRVLSNMWSFPSRFDIRDQLRGKNLACFCALDQPCHADVLLEIANATPDGGGEWVGPREYWETPKGTSTEVER